MDLGTLAFIAWVAEPANDKAATVEAKAVVARKTRICHD